MLIHGDYHMPPENDLPKQERCTIRLSSAGARQNLGYLSDEILVVTKINPASLKRIFVLWD